MKVCKKCEQEKPFSEFTTHKRSKDGYAYNCKECNARILREYRASDKGRAAAKESARKYYEENRETHYERTQKWARENRDKTREYSRRYYENNKDAAATRTAKRRSKVKESPSGDLKLAAQWRKMISQMPCYYCGSSESEKYHIDHRIPLSRGGEESWINLVRACETCNLAKYTKTDSEFLGFPTT